MAIPNYNYYDSEVNQCKVEENPLLYKVSQTKKSFETAARECNAVSVDSFFDELDERIKKRFNV